MESEASFDRSSRGRGEPESAKARFFQVQRIRSVGVLLLIRGKSNVCWRKSVRRGKERREGHTRRLVARRGLSHRLCSLDYKNSPFGRHSREYTRNESIISIDRSIDGSLMKIVNARETW